MTATAPPRPQTRPPAPAPRRPVVSWRDSMLAPAAAGAATLCAATSITSVVGGVAWFGYVFVAVLLIAATGLALRSLQAPTVAVGLGQVLVLLFLITGAFTTHGILAIIPGPEAIGELRTTLGLAADQIRDGLPPIDGTPPILCLVTILIGLVAVLVDTLAVAAAAPAATGLVLLCVYAVPAALADEMLPWWTFLLGAASFAALLAVDGNHRHRRWRTREAPGSSGKQGVLSIPVAVVATAIVLGLFGGAITWVGTVGRIPFGAAAGGNGRGVGGYGIQPFTQLRGMLEQGANAELFRVHGMGSDKRYLRAMTLDTYQPNKGWGLHGDGRTQQGSLIGPTLPLAPGDDGTGAPRAIQIEPTNWRDNWLPLIGLPRVLSGIDQNYLYDQVSGTVFTTSSERPPTYTEWASIKEPTADDLRNTPHATEVPPEYLQIDGVDPRVTAKTEQLISSATNDFDKATDIWRYFTAQNGFVYDTRTADATDKDALADFILKGKRGFCEQYASAMAVMLRVAHIPSRVAIGFTPGVPVADYLSVSSQDAHAWVEAYFGDRGWVTFDPTPLADGRGITPPYLQADSSNGGTSSNNQDVPSRGASSAPATGTPKDPAQQQQALPTPQQDNGDSLLLTIAETLLLLGVLALIIAGLLRAFLSYLRPHDEKAVRDSAPRPGRSPDPAARAEGNLLVRQAPAEVAAPPASKVDSLVGWLPLIATGFFIAALGFVAAMVAWWFAVLVVLASTLLAGPAAVRAILRRRRLSQIAHRSPRAADAAWAELAAECADRGLPIPESDTVRIAGQKLAQRHHLDDEGRAGLKTVIGAVERSWYGEAGEPDPALPAAFDRLRQSLRRTAPMSWRGRLFPRSVFHRR